MMVNIRKCAMIGCGFVGASAAFSLVESGLFSELVLIDANHDKAEGEAMDLSHGMPFARPMDIYAGSYDDLKDCGLIIVTAGANQKPNETRMDLVNKNVGIFKSIIPEIKKRECEGILLIVSNPVDILTYVALKLSGFPANRVIGSGTVLDTARLKYLLGEHLDVDSRSVHAVLYPSGCTANNRTTCPKSRTLYYGAFQRLAYGAWPRYKMEIHGEYPNFTTTVSTENNGL